MSFHYHIQSGMKKKKRFIALKDAYHGETLGALSMGDLDLYSSIYKPLMLDVIRVKVPDCYRCEFSKKENFCNCECFVYMEEELEKNSEEVSAVIIEPLVQAAAGMKIYPPLYLKKLREGCDKYKVHFIDRK